MTEGQRQKDAEALLLLGFAMEIAMIQVEGGRKFAFEHPSGASSWSTQAVQHILGLEGVGHTNIDMCYFGLSVDKSGDLSRKPTRLMSNCPRFLDRFLSAKCSGDHVRAQLIGGGMTSKARVYPPKFARALAEAIRSSVENTHPGPAPEEVRVVRRPQYQLLVEPPGGLCFPTGTGEAPSPNEAAAGGSEDARPDDEQGEEAEAEEGPGPEDEKFVITAPVKRMIHKVHVNLAHPHKDVFLKILKAAQAKPEVLRYVRDEFTCGDCQAHSRTAASRPAAVPKTFEFNKIIALDTFFLTFKDQQLAFLNVICHGTNFQVVELYDGTALGAWRAFMRAWVRPFGPPVFAITDGGPEFKGQFERGVEHLGIFHHITDSESPWQNGRAERHGGWVKEILFKASETTLVTTVPELETLVHEVTAAKNRYLHRGGFTPYQLVFGINPRIPSDILADDPIQVVGVEDLSPGSWDRDTASAEFARRDAIRRHARKELFESSSLKKLASAVKAPTHRDKHFVPGQWVYVWRRAPKGGQKTYALQMDRWREHIGPFVAILKDECQVLGEPQSGNLSVVDAKGIYDTLSKLTAGSKSDRRAAIDLAVVRTSMEKIGSAIRWMPHPLMPVDCMTKSDLAKTNAAQLTMLKSGMLRLSAEESAIQERKEDP
ncbi:unnamed protein product, partial [Prorocentrum cordatum]